MEKQTRPLEYRPNVAIVVINDEGLILACRRSDVEDAWQLPQGGIEANESLEKAMWRELEEEIGTADASLIGSLPDPIQYEWPEHLYERGYRGQRQYYFLVRLNRNACIDLTHHEIIEFDKTEWLTAEMFLAKVQGFKAQAYKEAIEKLTTLFPHQIKGK